MSASFVPPTDVSTSLAALPAVGPRTSTGADGSEVVGLVVAGAAARGPYAAGALTELLPALAAEGNPPTVLVGTSSGALSCALLAQFADQGERAGESLARIWQDISADAVFTNAWRTLSAVGLRLAAGLVLGRPVGGGLVSLVDTKPLWGLAARTFDPDRVTANIRAGLVRSVGVAATFCPPPPNVAARTRVFVAGMPPAAPEPFHGIDYVATPLALPHLLASAAIPTVFPPIKITQPADCYGYYLDGGIRLNVPIRPALDLGVTRLVVISSHSMSPPAGTATFRNASVPDGEAALAYTLRSMLADAMTDDLNAVGRRNLALSTGSAPAYRRLPYRCVVPPDGELAALAEAIYHEKYRRLLPRLNSYWPLGRLLDATGDGVGRNELLSLLLFDPDFAAAQIELGRRDARKALAQPWHVGPPPAETHFAPVAPRPAAA